ncbi:hypothetical protein lbkm_1228 [Lachnospiraceae bacterium KM106-2]|nr:hypothetical protein lbkm_1228 [Lachnospiraceae bacterium KM106-2]
MKIYLNSVDKVRTFVREVSRYDENVDLVSGRFMVDAKSILGIFSLDLSQPIEVVMDSDAPKKLQDTVLNYAA